MPRPFHIVLNAPTVLSHRSMAHIDRQTDTALLKAPYLRARHNKLNYREPSSLEVARKTLAECNRQKILIAVTYLQFKIHICFSTDRTLCLFSIVRTRKCFSFCDFPTYDLDFRIRQSQGETRYQTRSNVTSFESYRAHTHIHARRTNRSTGTTKVVGNKRLICRRAGSMLYFITFGDAVVECNLRFNTSIPLIAITHSITHSMHESNM